MRHALLFKNICVGFKPAQYGKNKFKSVDWFKFQFYLIKLKSMHKYFKFGMAACKKEYLF